jgi:hypothetical protein
MSYDVNTSVLEIANLISGDELYEIEKSLKKYEFSFGKKLFLLLPKDLLQPQKTKCTL